MRRKSPVFGALVNKHIWFGIERIWWVFALLVVAFAVMFLRQPLVGLFSVFVLGIGRIITVNDADQHKLYVKYKNQGFVYRAWDSKHAIRNFRPYGYGRNE